MLDIIENFNNSNLWPGSILLSFDIVNMLPSINNKMGM